MIDGTPSSSPESIPPTTEYERDPETGAVLIPLGGKTYYAGRFALLDPEDVPLIQGYKWRVLQPNTRGDRELLYASGYAYTPKRRDVYMHRIVLGLTDRRVFVDHINHNGLDNRRCNLRIGSNQQNIFNRRPNTHASSRFKGVSWHSRARKWVARIKYNDRVHHLGCFDDERQAAEVYDGAALMLFGSRAYLNFPDEVAP